MKAIVRGTAASVCFSQNSGNLRHDRYDQTKRI